MEIAAWVAERKKKFPTKARAAEAAERKRKHEEEQRAARQAAKESQAKRRAEARIKQEEEKAAKERRREDMEKARNESAAESANGDAKALRAKARVEKLRRRLEKEERRVAKAQAKALKSKPGVEKQAAMSGSQDGLKESGSHEEMGHGTNSEVVDPIKSTIIQSQNSNSEHGVVKSGEATATQKDLQEHDASTDASAVIAKTSADATSVANPLTPTSQYSLPDQEPPPPTLEITSETRAKTASAEPVARTADSDRSPKLEESNGESDLSMSTTTSDISSSSEDDDDTSSEGTSSSSDDAPKVVPSKRTAPDKVPPPRREKPKSKSNDICRNFLRSGRCPRGDQCRFRHEQPEKGAKLKTTKPAKGEWIKKERKSLYQRVCPLAQASHV